MEKILLVGAGPMAEAYAQVLTKLECEFIVIGRGEASARSFTESTGADVIAGGLDLYLENTEQVPEKVIIVTSVEQTQDNCKKLLERGCKHILLEKPGALDTAGISELLSIANEQDTEVVLAYNRRFYSSVVECKRLIAEDGGVRSFNFEFTEWSHTIEPLEKAEGVKERWFLVNSTHVVDLAFYLGGKPKMMQSQSSGELSWHAKSNFSGAGTSETDALFSYHADWAAPGRWSVEILTKNHKIILCPLEKLQEQEIGSVKTTFVDVQDQKDEEFKPGIYEQTDAFLKGDYSNFCSLSDQKEAFETYYSQICPY